MQLIVVLGSSAASVETLQAHVKAIGVIDRVETLSAIFSIDRLRGIGGLEGERFAVGARHCEYSNSPCFWLKV